MSPNSRCKYCGAYRDEHREPDLRCPQIPAQRYVPTPPAPDCPECAKTVAGCASCERRSTWDVDLMPYAGLTKAEFEQAQR